MTLEELTASTILGEAKEVNIGKRTIKMARPTIATLIEVSRRISLLPKLPSISTTEDAVTHTLAFAGDCEVLGEIAAILVLGKKNLTSIKRIEKSRLFGLLKTETTEEVDNVKPLASELLEELTCQDLYQLVVSAIEMQNIAFFLQLTNSLNEANLLKESQNKKAIASGQ